MVVVQASQASGTSPAFNSSAFFQCQNSSAMVVFSSPRQRLKIQLYSLNAMVRHGIRYPKQWERFLENNKQSQGNTHTDDVLDLEVQGNLDVKLNSDQLISLSFQPFYMVHKFN
uniref:Uncharacterized protein n=1 Tax=Ditylenchus dipsaci TaxID=166011 RepID=A0A915CX18_9BILA